MRPHHESLMAMRVSAALMSMSAALLVVMLLTGDAQAKVIAEAQRVRDEAAQAAIVTTQQIMPTAIVPSLQKLTAQASIASRVAAQFQPTVKAPTRTKAAASSIADIPAMPKLGTIPAVPKVNIQARTVVVVQQAAAQPQAQAQPKVVTKTS